MPRILCCFCSLIFMLTGIAIIAISVLVFIDFDDLYEERVKSQMIIEDGSVSYDNWIEPKVIDSIKYYFFELENPKEFLLGKKAKVKEVGPYVFRYENRFDPYKYCIKIIDDKQI